MCTHIVMNISNVYMSLSLSLYIYIYIYILYSVPSGIRDLLRLLLKL